MSAVYGKDTREISFYKQVKEPWTGDNDTAITLNKIKSDFGVANESNRTNGTLVQNYTLTTFGGMPAYEAVWSFKNNNAPPLIYNKQIWTVTGNYLYGIIYSSNQNYYTTSLPQVDQIINSFEFI